MVLLFVAQAAHSTDAKPLRIVAGYGQTAAIFFGVPQRYPYYYRLPYGALTEEELRRASAVILAEGAQVAVKDAVALTAFLREGGRLVMVGRSANAVLPLLKEVVGANARLVDVRLSGFRPSGAHPLFGGLDAEEWPQISIRWALAGMTGGAILLARERQAAAWVEPVGKGQLIYLSEELFPPYGTDGKAAKTVAKRRGRLVDNLLTFLQTPRLADLVEGTTPTVWVREPEVSPFEGARSMYPLTPRPNEIIDVIEITVGRNEHERLPFYVTWPETPETFRASLKPLKGKRGSIPASNIAMGLQDRLGASITCPNVFARWLEPGETLPAFSPVMTLWLDVDAGEAVPGTYEGTLGLEAGERRIDLPLRVEVTAATIPRRRPFHFEVEYYNRVYRSPQMDYLRHWRGFGVDTAIGGYLSYSVVDPPVRATGERLSEYATKANTPFGDNLPLLDFSSLDPFYHAALQHDLTLFRGYYCFMGEKNFVNAAKTLYRTDDPTPAQVRTTAVNMLREVRRYLNEKGIVDVYSKTGDEWGPANLDGYLATATRLNDAGWGNVANPCVKSVLAVRGRRRKLWPVVRVWWMEGEPKLWHRLREVEPALGGPTEIEGGYWMVLTSSYWWNQHYLRGLRMGWGGAWRDYEGLHFHGFLRNNPGGIYLIKEGQREIPCTSVGYTMLAEGVEEGQYLVMLRDMIRTLEKRGKKSLVDSLEAEAAAIVVDAPEALLPVVKDLITKDGLSRADFTQAKLRVMDLIAKARGELADVKPSLRWGDVHLVKDGSPAVSIVTDEAGLQAADALRDGVRRDTGVSLADTRTPIADAELGKAAACVVLSLLEDEEDTARAAKRLQGHVNARYPKAGGYAIVLDAKKNLWIVARDLDSLLHGVNNLLRCARLDPFWYRAG